MSYLGSQLCPVKEVSAEEMAMIVMAHPPTTLLVYRTQPNEWPVGMVVKSDMDETYYQWNDRRWYRLQVV